MSLSVDVFNFIQGVCLLSVFDKVMTATWGLLLHIGPVYNGPQSYNTDGYYLWPGL